MIKTVFCTNIFLISSYDNLIKTDSNASDFSKIYKNAENQRAAFSGFVAPSTGVCHDSRDPRQSQAIESNKAIGDVHMP